MFRGTISTFFRNSMKKSIFVLFVSLIGYAAAAASGNSVFSLHLGITASMVKIGDSYRMVEGKKRNAVAFARFDEAIHETGIW